MEKVLFVKYMEIPLDFFLKITEHMSINQKVVGKIRTPKKKKLENTTLMKILYILMMSKLTENTFISKKYSSFRGECKAYKNKEDFKKNFDLESLTKENKI